jgi:hypothetical protein
MAGQNTSILASDYNAIQTKAALALGSGSGTFGYGQTVSSSQVAQNAKITATQWYNLRSDILRCRQHQTGTDLEPGLTNPYINVIASQTAEVTNRITVSDTSRLTVGMPIFFTGVVFGNIVFRTTYYVLTVVNSTQITISATLNGTPFVLVAGTGTMYGSVPQTNGTKIFEADRAAYDTMITTASIDNNRLIAPPANQATRENLVNTQSRTTSWNGFITQTVTVTFADANARRYYFNTGSRFEFSSTRSGGTSGDKNTSWTTLLTNMGVVYFNRTDTTCTGTGTNSTIGNDDLTTSDQIVFIKDVSGTTYFPNRYQIKARSPSAAQIIFTIEWRDDSPNPNTTVFAPGFGPYGTDENVDGTLTSLVQVYRSSGVNVTVPKPPATTTTL